MVFSPKLLIFKKKSIKHSIAIANKQIKNLSCWWCCCLFGQQVIGLIGRNLKRIATCAMGCYGDRWSAKDKEEIRESAREIFLNLDNIKWSWKNPPVTTITTNDKREPSCMCAATMTTTRVAFRDNEIRMLLVRTVNKTIYLMLFIPGRWLCPIVRILISLKICVWLFRRFILTFTKSIHAVLRWNARI